MNQPLNSNSDMKSTQESPASFKKLFNKGKDLTYTTEPIPDDKSQNSVIQKKRIA